MDTTTKPKEGTMVLYGHSQERIAEILAMQTPMGKPYVGDFIVNADGCWTSVYATNVDGYAKLKRDGKVQFHHRRMYYLLKGDLIEGMELDHLCRVPGCVRPDHLEQVTSAENVKRGLSGDLRPPFTHCKHGHEMTEANTYIQPSNGQRKCRVCMKVSKAAEAARLKAGIEPHSHEDPNCKNGHHRTKANTTAHGQCRPCHNERQAAGDRRAKGTK